MFEELRRLSREVPSIDQKELSKYLDDIERYYKGGKIMYKKGDKVFDIKYGWGVVRAIVSSVKYPIEVEFENGILKTYTENGKYIDSDSYPSLMFKEPNLAGCFERPRWRANKRKEYCYIDCDGSIGYQTDTRENFDDCQFKSGNYFKSEQEAKESKFYKIFHKEEK